MPMKKIRNFLSNTWCLIQLIYTICALWLFGDYKAHREDYE